MHRVRLGARCACACLIGLALLTPSVSAAAQGGTGAAAKELGALLAAGDAPGPRFVAAEDPTDASRFVAAMVLPDLQILLISARYSTPVLLRERVLTRKYQDAYLDLHSASLPAGKIVIEDLLANGLASKPAKGESADSATLDGRAVTFDGQWRKAKLKEEEYTGAFAQAEQEYTRLLGLLIAQAKAK